MHSQNVKHHFLMLIHMANHASSEAFLAVTQPMSTLWQKQIAEPEEKHSNIEALNITKLVK